FFQAEDGIRDKLVTGVQTCALPICLTPCSPSQRCRSHRWPARRPPCRTCTDRKSVVYGKSVDLGGRRIIEKNNIPVNMITLYHETSATADRVLETQHRQY